MGSCYLLALLVLNSTVSGWCHDDASVCVLRWAKSTDGAFVSCDTKQVSVRLPMRAKVQQQTVNTGSHFRVPLLASKYMVHID